MPSFADKVFIRATSCMWYGEQLCEVGAGSALWLRQSVICGAVRIHLAITWESHVAFFHMRNVCHNVDLHEEKMISCLYLLACCLLTYSHIKCFSTYIWGDLFH